MSKPLSAVLAGLAGIVALAAGGCSEKSTVHTHFTPDVVAVTAPDSVPTGQALVVKVHWRGLRTCQSLDTFGFNAVDDTTIELIVRGVETVDPDVSCDPVDTLYEGSSTIDAAKVPQKRFHLHVYGAAQHYVLDVQGGATPIAGERHSVLVQNAVNDAPVAGATARVIDLDTADTLAVLTTDANGEAESAADCVKSPRPYQLWVIGASGRQAHLYFRQNPARCGIAERTQTRF
jgi:hypothetical protein